jgi:hypothetical protein
MYAVWALPRSSTFKFKMTAGASHVTGLLLEAIKLRQTRLESEAKAKKPVPTDNTVRCVKLMWP